jgi:hypothetical protein
MPRLDKLSLGDILGKGLDLSLHLARMSPIFSASSLAAVHTADFFKEVLFLKGPHFTRSSKPDPGARESCGGEHCHGRPQSLEVIVKATVNGDQSRRPSQCLSWI